MLESEIMVMASKMARRGEVDYFEVITLIKACMRNKADKEQLKEICEIGTYGQLKSYFSDLASRRS